MGLLKSVVVLVVVIVVLVVEEEVSLSAKSPGHRGVGLISEG